MELDMVDNSDMLKGKIVSLPEPDVEKDPSKADLLSNFDSSTKSPENGKKAKAKKPPSPERR